jgi:RNA polymerase-binding transcription factor DksA
MARLRRRNDIAHLELQRYRAVLRTKLLEQREELADCKALLDELAFSRDKEAIQLRGLTRRAEMHALAAIDDIEQALARLDEGTYTHCVRCGDPIGNARLDVLPTTRHCINCASLGRRSS